MTKNASIILFILVIVTLAGYLVWLNRRFPGMQSENTNATAAPQVQVTPSVATEGALIKKTASPSATLVATASSRPRR